MEQAFLQWLARRVERTGFTQIGIGDDCAVLAETDARLVVTTDTVCEGVHFHSSDLSLEQIGRKALAVNLSDLASMGACPKAALVSMTIPRSSSLDEAKRLFRGLEQLAKIRNVEICGGDTTVWDGQWVVSVTAIGLAPDSGSWTMDCARPGDQIVVTGTFGGSILKKHWAFEPCLDFSNFWRDRDCPITACTDASDSLGWDLANIAKASHVGFEIELESIPVSEDAVELSRTTGKSPLQHALCDGEDFELIMAICPERLAEMLNSSGHQTLLTRIGEFTEDPSFFSISDNLKSPFVPHGYVHSLESNRDGR